MDSFVNLHVHTDGSLLDGLGSIHRLVASAKSKGFSALAMTDHGTLTNAISFSVECKENGIKPILGEEIYILFGSNQIGHMTLLAKNRQGFDNIIEMTTMAHASKNRRPAVTFDSLKQHSDGVICLTGCIASPIHQLDYKDALRYAIQLKEIFGKRLFAEIIFFNEEDHYSRVVKIAKTLDLKIVVTNDSHFPDKSDAQVHPILTTIRAKYTYASSQLWLKTYDELFSYAQRVAKDIKGVDVKQWLGMSKQIADSIDEIDLSGTPTLPSLGKNEYQMLLDIISGALKKDISRLETIDVKIRVKRAKTELRVIRAMGFSAYFLILKDLVDYARKMNVFVGPGRGSGAGSYLLFLLGITELDPIKYGLQFERFLNENRVGYPDVDVDLDSEGRQLVIKYAEEKYGAKAVATYAHFSHKTLVHDLCRTLRLDRATEIKAADDGVDSEAFKELKRESELFGIAYQALNNQIRHRGKHAGGIIITSKTVPFERAGDELVVPWTEGGREGGIRELSYAGLVKYDLLGLSALSVLKYLFNVTKKLPPADPNDDLDVLDIFKSGDLSGIFQFSGSQGIRDLTIAIQPTEFADIIAINALYRPGTLSNGLAWKYSGFKKKPRHLHKQIDNILAETYGIIVFQEQMMNVYATITGGSLAEADEARRVLSKDPHYGDPVWEASLDKLKTPFFTNGIKNGFDKKFVNQLWGEIFAHSAYSFNKCISGDTILTRGSASKTQGLDIAIRELYSAWHSQTAWGAKLKSKGVNILQLDVDGRVRPALVKAIYYNGCRDVYKVTTARGNSVKATLNHRLLTQRGYTRVDELKLSDSLVEAYSDHGYIRYDKIVEIEFAGTEDVYDVEMDTKQHNFIANGIVSHNSHAACYSMIAWRMAWYKHYFPTEFYAASMMFDNNNFQTYLFDAIRNDIKVLPPDVNTSTAQFESKDDKIFLPITSVKYMAAKGANAIVTERQAGGEFKSFADFRKRIPKRAVNSRACQSLYAVDGMNIDGLPSDAGIDISKIPKLDKFALQYQYMGAILPTKKIFEKIESLSKIDGVIAGIVTSKNRKESSFGKYTVYHLSPSGTFWIRDSENNDNIDVGQFLVVSVRKSSGKALKIKIVKV